MNNLKQLADSYRAVKSAGKRNAAINHAANLLIDAAVTAGVVDVVPCGARSPLLDPNRSLYLIQALQEVAREEAKSKTSRS